MNPLLTQLQTALTRSLAGLDATATQFRPNNDPSKWTVQQIAEHLHLTYEATARAFDDRLAKGRPSMLPVTLKQRFNQWIVLGLGYFPPGRVAPDMVVPAAASPAQTGDALAARATDLLTRFDGMADAAEALFGSERALTHPALGPLNVQQWRQFHRVHGLHHAKQIDGVRGALATPRP